VGALKEAATKVREIYKRLCAIRGTSELADSTEPLETGGVEWCWIRQRSDRFEEKACQESTREGKESGDVPPAVCCASAAASDASATLAVTLVHNVMAQVERDLVTPWPPTAPKAAIDALTGPDPYTSAETEAPSERTSASPKVQDHDPFESELSIPPALRQGLRAGTVRRHGLQHQCLLGVAAAYGTLRGAHAVCEVGAGKAGLLHAIVAIQQSQRYAARTVRAALRERFDKTTEAFPLEQEDSSADEQLCSSVGKAKVYFAIDSERFSHRADPHIHSMLNATMARLRASYPDKQHDDLKLLRVRMDLRDFALCNLRSATPFAAPVAIVGKHLCGAATDATLRMMVNGLLGRATPDAGSEPARGIPITGLLLATCCHHRCTWESFAARSLLADWGVDSDLCRHMSRWSSWFTSHEDGEPEDEEEAKAMRCGSALGCADERLDEKEEHDFVIEDTTEVEPNLAYLVFSRRITEDEKAELGFKCKLIFDAARAIYLADTVTQVPHPMNPVYRWVNKATVRLVRYCDVKITKENLAIAASFEYTRL